MAEKKGLGRGLNAIFGDDVNVKPDEKKGFTKKNVLKENVNTVNTEKGLYVKIGKIQPDPKQPRMDFKEEDLKELSESIKEYGVITPLIVKKNGAFFEIIAGERRWRAAKMAGLREVPVVVREVDDKEAREISIVENIQRSDLNPIEEAFAYQSLIDEYNMTQETVAKRVSKNRATIANSLRLLKLSDNIKALLRDGRLSQGHARALLGIEDIELREKIAEKCVKDQLSVRDIESLVKKEKQKENKEDAEETREIKRLKLLYKDIENTLKGHLGSKVSVNPKSEDRGVIHIEYYSKDDLDRIFKLLNS